MQTRENAAFEDFFFLASIANFLGEFIYTMFLHYSRNENGVSLSSVIHNETISGFISFTLIDFILVALFLPILGLPYIAALLVSRRNGRRARRFIYFYAISCFIGIGVAADKNGVFSLPELYCVVEFVLVAIGALLIPAVENPPLRSTYSWE